MTGEEGTFGPACPDGHCITSEDVDTPMPVPPGDHCITCGDVAVEVRVVRLLDDGLADVDTGEGTERVSVALVTAAAGDTVLVHAGEAIAVVGKVTG